METRRPLVAEIKRNSLDDGPGIRSVVFFKGCPLACVWCHNPECIKTGPELLWREAQCIGCKSCAQVCPERAIDEAGPGRVDEDKCTRCGECAEECPSGALAMIGKYYEPDDLVRALARDQAFYANSGGGVTLSGGEPTLALDYAAEIARKLKEHQIHVLIETCGDFDWPGFERKLLPYIDQVYVDLKVFDSDKHKEATGRDNVRIKANIERLVRSGPPTLLRIPLVPDLTAARDNLEASAQWFQSLGVRRIALLPYNPLWLAKSRGLGRNPAYTRETWMSREEREEVKKIFAGFELERDIV